MVHYCKEYEDLLGQNQLLTNQLLLIQRERALLRKIAFDLWKDAWPTFQLKELIELYEDEYKPFVKEHKEFVP